MDNKMWPRGRSNTVSLQEQWNASLRAMHARTATSPTWRPDEVVLHLADPPSPARQFREEVYRQRSVDETRERKRTIVREYGESQPVNILGRTVRLNDPELSHAEQFVPIR